MTADLALDADHKPLFLRVVGSPSTLAVVSSKPVIDESGRIFLAGRFQKTLDFDCQSGPPLNAPRIGLFAVLLDSAGHCIAQTSVEGTAADIWSPSLALAGDGQPVVATPFAGSLGALKSEGGTDVALFKFGLAPN